VSYCVNVTSGSLLKRNRLLAQIQAWDKAGEQIITIVQTVDKGLLEMALDLVGGLRVHASLTVGEFKDFVNTRVKKISSDTPKPVEGGFVP